MYIIEFCSEIDSLCTTSVRHIDLKKSSSSYLIFDELVRVWLAQLFSAGDARRAIYVSVCIARVWMPRIRQLERVFTRTAPNLHTIKRSARDRIRGRMIFAIKSPRETSCRARTISIERSMNVFIQQTTEYRI